MIHNIKNVNERKEKRERERERENIMCSIKLLDITFYSVIGSFKTILKPMLVCNINGSV
jgi:hypothetical protein